MKPSGIGGMAVMEGVMMRNKEEYAVAVRKPNNEIAVEKSTHKDFSDKVRLFKLPIFRGMLAFVDSLVVGIKVLNFSSSFFEDEEETQNKNRKANSKGKKQQADAQEEVSATKSDTYSLDNAFVVEKPVKKDENSNALLMFFAVLLSVVLSVSLFMVLPVLISGLLKDLIKNDHVMNIIEALIRLTIFIGYVAIASRMPEIKRVFMYHGAEHKTINCIENGFELTVENVKWQSKQHKRCGTSFMLLVIIISAIFFMLLPTYTLLWRVLSRVILVPFIAGVSYEFIRLAGKSENKVVNILSKPGLWMQGLTTKEPDDSMIEVAIESVNAVFDWKAFLDTSKAKEAKKTKNLAVVKKQAETKSVSSSKHTDSSKVVEKQAILEKQERSIKQESSAKQDSSKKQQSSTKHGNPAKNETHIKSNTLNKSMTTPIQSKTSKAEEEDDEILKALDKYFADGSKESGKAGEFK